MEKEKREFCCKPAMGIRVGGKDSKPVIVGHQCGFKGGEKMDIEKENQIVFYLRALYYLGFCSLGMLLGIFVLLGILI